MILHVLAPARSDDVLAVLDAARGRSVAVVVLDHPTVDALEDGDGLVALCDAPWALRAERWLAGPGVRTIYRSPLRAWSKVDDRAALHHAGLPGPDEVPVVADRDTLRALVDRLGGYPVTLRAGPRFLGDGVVPIDSPAALFSAVDLALTLPGARPVLRRGDAWHTLRTVVVAEGEAVTAWERSTWVDTPWVSPLSDYDDAICAAAAAAVGLRLALVSLTHDRDGAPRVVGAAPPRGLGPDPEPVAHALVGLFADQ